MGKCNADTAKKEGYITQLGRNWNNGSNTNPFFRNVNNVSSSFRLSEKYLYPLQLPAERYYLNRVKRKVAKT